MKRRQALTSMLGVATVAGASPSSSEAQGFSLEAIEQMLRHQGMEPLPGEAARVREMLLVTRFGGSVDPRIDPAVRFDPEVDP
jgi:hypothetical protein